MLTTDTLSSVGRISKQQNGWYWFPAAFTHGKKTGFYAAADINDKSTLPVNVRFAIGEIMTLPQVDDAYVSVGGMCTPDRFGVKFNDDSALVLVQDIIVEYLG